VDATIAPFEQPDDVLRWEHGSISCSWLQLLRARRLLRTEPIAGRFMVLAILLLPFRAWSSRFEKPPFNGSFPDETAAYRIVCVLTSQSAIMVFLTVDLFALKIRNV